MMVQITWGRALAVAAALATAAFAFWWVAPYGIAARVQHWPPVRAALHGYMNNAVRLRTLGVQPPPFVDPQDPALIRLGAAHYATGCATCHGAPGLHRNPIVEMMLPQPPFLAEEPPRELPALHWLTYNGLKYTGMPGWAGEGRQDEAWAVAAFLDALPDMDAATYHDLAYGTGRAAKPAEAVPFGQPVGALTTTENCARCHGRDGQGRRGTAPRLAGQSRAHLRRALDLYAGDLRQSGIMEPVAAALTEAQREALAIHFAALPVTVPAEAPEGAGNPARGAALARHGDSRRSVGACFGCHGQPDNAAPRIAGQHPRFLAAWLRLWREGAQTPGPEAERMAAAVRGLTDRDIDDLSAYLSQILRPPTEGATR